MDEKSSFVMVFGESPMVKVIDFLIDNQEFDYSLTEITRNAGIGWTTIHHFWYSIVKLNIVKRTRRIGRAELYKLNKDNQLVQKLLEIDLLVSQQLARKEMKQKVIA